MKRPYWSFGQIAGTLTAVLLVGFLLVPMPYVTTAAGQTQDVLGSYEDSEGVVHPVIHIEGAPTFATSGKLLLTTVGVSGSRESPLAMLNVLASWISPSQTVAPVEVYYPPQTTSDEVREINLAEMASSQNSASVAALSELGYEVPATLKVVGAMNRDEVGLDEDEDITRAVDVIEDGDIIEAVDGHDITTYAQLLDVVKELTPDEPVDVSVQRDGEQVTLSFAPYTYPTAADQDLVAVEPATRLGVLLNPDYDMPFDITIDAERIGGPSAGVMFALGIIDQLTEGELTGGETIAGSGTVDVDGSVGPIGGIDHKLDGAVRAGADWFVAAAANCGDITRVPSELEVIAVENLHEAYQALQDIAAGSTDNLPRCPQP